jgi:hypothetical protein
MRHRCCFVELSKRIADSRLWLVFFSLLALLTVAANVGHVTMLSASGGANLNETITINATVVSDDGVTNSNFYFEIRAADGTVVATNTFEGVPQMEGGQSYSYSWQSNNSSYSVQGDYSVSLCWSTGNARNCNVASATTTFYAANTLDPLLYALLVGLAMWWVLKRRGILFNRRQEAL